MPKRITGNFERSQYKTVASMKLDKIREDQEIVTLGYTTRGDLGHAEYAVITSAQFGGVPDELINHTLANGNIAVLQGDELNVKQCGIIQDSDITGATAVTDNKANLDIVFNYGITNNKNIYFPDDDSGLAYGLDTRVDVALLDGQFLNVRGDGKGKSIVFGTIGGFIIRGRLTSQTPSNGFGTSVFKDMSFNGNWLSRQAELNESRGFIFTGLIEAEIHNVEVKYTTFMGITHKFCRNVVVDNCRVKFTTRDCVNSTDCLNIRHTNNYIKGSRDDGLAGHWTDGTTGTSARSIICTGNLLEECFGIKYLGAQNAVIQGNVCRRTLSYGINIGIDIAFSEGGISQYNVSITGNTVDHLLNPVQLGEASDLAVGIFLHGKYENSEIPLSGVFTDFGNLLTRDTGADYPFYAGDRSIVIANNTMTKYMLSTASNWSDLGYDATIFNKTGFENPSLSTSSGSSQGIRTTDGANALINNNYIEGFKFPIEVTGNSTEKYLPKLTITNNQLIDCTNAIRLPDLVSLFEGFYRINNNTINIDPSHKSDQRNSDGSWSTSGSATSRILFTTNSGFNSKIEMKGNKFINCNGTQLKDADYAKDNIFIGDFNSSTFKGNRVTFGEDRTLTNVVSDPQLSTYGEELGWTDGINADGYKGSRFRITGTIDTGEEIKIKYSSTNFKLRVIFNGVRNADFNRWLYEEYLVRFKSPNVGRTVFNTDLNSTYGGAFAQTNTDIIYSFSTDAFKFTMEIFVDTI